MLFAESIGQDEFAVFQPLFAFLPRLVETFVHVALGAVRAVTTTRCGIGGGYARLRANQRADRIKNNELDGHFGNLPGALAAATVVIPPQQPEMLFLKIAYDYSRLI